MADFIDEINGLGLLTDCWESGLRMYQDSGATSPVTAADQTVASWVGRNGVKLTTTGSPMKAKSIGGILTPVSISDLESVWVVPASVSVNQQDWTAWHHVQVGNGLGAGMCGFGSDRGVELYTSNRVFYSTDPAIGAARDSNLNALASAHVAAIEGTASALTIRRNASEYNTGAALPAGSVTGGFIGALNSAGSTALPVCARWHGIVLTKALSASQRTSLLAYFDARVTRPSDTTPIRNIVVMGDSTASGTQAGGVSWQWMFGDDGSRVVSHVLSGSYFSFGGAPQNAAINGTAIDTDYRAGASLNVVILMDTNDFSALTAAQCLSAREAWAALRQAAGWRVMQPYMPFRTPLATWTAHNAVVTTFNALLASSSAFNYRPNVFGALGGAAPTAALFNEHHFTAAGQQVVYNTLYNAINLPSTGWRARKRKLGWKAVRT